MTSTVAILKSDLLFARALDLSAQLGVEMTRIMADTLARLCEGAIAEVQGSVARTPEGVTALPAVRELYLDVIAGKAAWLIETPFRHGAKLSDVDAAGVHSAAGGDELATLLAGELSDADVERALDLLRGSDGLVRARDEAAERVRVACGHLEGFGERPVVTALERLAHYALDRMG